MKKVLAFLSSLKLAVILLVLLLVGLSAGTIIESRLGAEVAGNVVYYAWWFLALQALFATNVSLSIVDHFPWGKQRVGYLITHAGLIIVFASSVASYFFKVEGNLGLWEGESGNVFADVDRSGNVRSEHRLPFTVKLLDFRIDHYPGTMRPAGFASFVEITDAETGKTFPARVWMNHELTYRGYSLFQSSYRQEMGREATILSVSKDPGQMPVFVGYVVLVLGMCVVLFTRIGQARRRAAEEAQEPPGGSGAGRAAVGVLLALLAGSASAAPASTADVLRRLPVQHDGRTMPLDTLAREAVWQITGSRSWHGEDPVESVAAWVTDPRTSANAPVVRLGSSKLAAAIGLAESTTHASFVQLVGNQRLLQLMETAHQQAAREIPRKDVLADAEKLEERLVRLQSFLNREAVRPVPVPGNPMARWSPAPQAAGGGELLALMRGDRLVGWPPEADVEREITYNRVNPARVSWLVLLASLVVSVLAWVRGKKLLDGVAFALLLAGFAAMTWGLGMRWAVGDRIPAANMYESLLFLAWGVGLFAVVATPLLRSRLVVLNAGVMATLTMALTDLLPMDRFIHPVPPVLAGTAWLAIHVPIIMVGYSVLALGVVVAHMQVGYTIFAPRKTDVIDRMYDLNYWYMFVGSILLIAGILTGSMWAASSWGRYWGWDPKEVWSLVAFLAYMAILHARVDRMIGKFGVAAISIVAFQTILMTYLGVNYVLGTGMHSYGFGDSPVLMWMVIVAAVEAAFLLWGWNAYRKVRAQLGEAAPG
jgi:cytochrome c-type biogenesis protein CcsB